MKPKINPPKVNGIGAHTVQNAHAAKAGYAEARSRLTSNGDHPSMLKAIGSVLDRDAMPTSHTVMQELRKGHPDGKIDGVKLNRSEVGRWLKTHGFLP